MLLASLILAGKIVAGLIIYTVVTLPLAVIVGRALKRAREAHEAWEAEHYPHAAMVNDYVKDHPTVTTW